MICPPCRRAGELNRDANQVTGEEAAEYLRARARQEHSKCTTDCYCHHWVGDYIREEGHCSFVAI